MNRDNTNKNFSEENFEDVDLKKLFNFLFRNRFKIILASLGISFITILFSYSQKIVWQGNFQIVVEKKDDNNNMQNNILSSIIPIPGNKLLNDTLTQENILKSPYLLIPVYENFSKEIKKNGYKFISYDEWIDKYLKINFLEESKVLNVKFMHHDREIIISTLLDISKRYQNYSKEDKIKSLKRSSDFLKSQLSILSNKSENSLKNFNEFSIENGLGDIDGFVELNPNKFNIIKDKSSTINNNNRPELLSLKTGAGQRFKSQLILLERLEAEYAALLAKLKPESKELINLKKSIISLKESLKRPNEIILEFRTLKREAERDLFLLAQVESQLNLTKFEQAKEEEPWQIISNPIIENNKIYPRRSLIGIVSFSLTFIATSSIIYLKERKSGKLFDIDEINKYFLFSYIDDLKYRNYELNELIINNALIKNLKEYQISKIGIVVSSKQFNNNKFLDTNEFFDYQFKEINLKSIKKNDMDKFQKIIIFVEKDNISINEITILNNYLDLYKEKVLGFFTLNSNQFN